MIQLSYGQLPSIFKLIKISFPLDNIPKTFLTHFDGASHISIRFHAWFWLTNCLADCQVFVFNKSADLSFSNWIFHRVLGKKLFSLGLSFC